MSWVIFALLFPALIAFVNVLDKFLIEKRIRDYLSLMFVIGFISLCVGLLLALFISWHGAGFKHVLLGLFAGMLIGVNYFVYFKALTFEEVSRVVSIYYTTPIIVLFLASIILGESLPVWKYGAIILATLGAVLIGMDRFERIPIMRRGFWLIVFSCVLIGFININAKYLLKDISPWNVIALETLGLSIVLLMLVFSKRARMNLKQTMKSFPLIVISECSTYLSWLFFNMAAALTEVSKVSAMGSLQPLYVLIFMVLLSSFMPHILKEVFTRKTFAIKAIAILMIVIGTFFVAL